MGNLQCLSRCRDPPDQYLADISNGKQRSARWTKSIQYIQPEISSTPLDTMQNQRNTLMETGSISNSLKSRVSIDTHTKTKKKKKKASNLKPEKKLINNIR